MEKLILVALQAARFGDGATVRSRSRRAVWITLNPQAGHEQARRRPALVLFPSAYTDQVKNLDWRVRKAEFICKLPRKTTDEVLEKLGTLLAAES